MKKNKSILLAAAGLAIASSPANSEKVYSYFNPVAVSAPVEVAMRPPAPAFDTGVPQPQQIQIQQYQQYQQYQPPAPQMPQYGQPSFQGQYQGLGGYPQQQSMVQRRPEPVKKEEDDGGRSSIIAGRLSGAAGLTTDYVFRGVSQTRESPGVQAGMEYQHYMGLYAGIWGSNVNFGSGSDTNIEIDGYGGYRFGITKNLSGDIGAMYYAYPGSEKKLHLDYWEAYAALKYGIPIGFKAPYGFGLKSVPVGVALNYSPEFTLESGSAYYLKGTIAVPFKNGLTFDAHLGHQWVEDNTAFGLPDYLDWSAGIGYSFLEDYEVKVQYIENDIDEDKCGDGCDRKAVATLSKSF